MAFVLDRPLYLTADKKEVVEEGDPRARFVLGVAGSEIPNEMADELGLLTIDRKATRPLVQELGEEPEEEAKAKQPAQNKVMVAKANKGK